MEIVVTQKKISIGDKYKIYVDGEPTHKASKQLLQILAEIVLVDNNAIKSKITINKRFSWIKPMYDITGLDHTVLKFRTKSFWKRHYQCQFDSDTYDIYRHRGRKYSVYKNNTQVAYWDKSPITWFEGDHYTITADYDCNADLLISFCLIVDNISGNHGSEVITINIGSIGFQVKKFDFHWQPKEYDRRQS